MQRLELGDQIKISDIRHMLLDTLEWVDWIEQQPDHQDTFSLADIVMVMAREKAWCRDCGLETWPCWRCLC